jgi:hypothetical protein
MIVSTTPSTNLHFKDTPRIYKQLPPTSPELPNLFTSLSLLSLLNSYPAKNLHFK